MKLAAHDMSIRLDSWYFSKIFMLMFKYYLSFYAIDYEIACSCYSVSNIRENKWQKLTKKKKPATIKINTIKLSV